MKKVKKINNKGFKHIKLEVTKYIHLLYLYVNFFKWGVQRLKCMLFTFWIKKSHFMALGQKQVRTTQNGLDRIYCQIFLVNLNDKNDS